MGHQNDLSSPSVNGEFEASLVKRPDFALFLSQSYLQTNHLEAARDALKEVPEDGENGQRARMLQLEIHARQGADTEVLRLGRAMAAEMPESLWPFRRLAQAAFASGDRKEAHEAALRSLEYLPSNAEVAACLADVAPGALQPDLFTLVRESAGAGICPHGVMDSLLPVIRGVRPTACLFDDGIGFVVQGSMSPSEIRRTFSGLAAQLFGTYGIRMGFLRYGALAGGRFRPMGKIYFSRDPNLHAVVDHLERLHWENFHGGSGKRLASERFLVEEGALLGYPPCCVQWAARLRESGKDFEGEAARALIFEEGAVRFFENENHPPPESAYFAFEFYPCHPRCAAAEATGSLMITGYSEGDSNLGEAFRTRMIPLNKQRIWNANELTPYPHFVREFNAKLFTASLSEWEQDWLRTRE
jgi:hypothetical protein